MYTILGRGSPLGFSVCMCLDSKAHGNSRIEIIWNWLLRKNMWISIAKNWLDFFSFMISGSKMKKIRKNQNFKWRAIQRLYYYKLKLIKSEFGAFVCVNKLHLCLRYSFLFQTAYSLKFSESVSSLEKVCAIASFFFFFWCELLKGKYVQVKMKRRFQRERDRGRESDTEYKLKG